jgi:hypothetical protein
MSNTSPGIETNVLNNSAHVVEKGRSSAAAILVMVNAKIARMPDQTLIPANFSG